VERFRKEEVIHVGLLAMGVGVAVLGAVAVIVNAFGRAAGRVGGFITHHVHALPPGPHNIGLIPPAMAIAFVIGLAMAMSTIPAQTLVFERTSEELRGRVLSLQQLIGGAAPIIPLLTLAPLADIFGTSTVMIGLGVVIVLVGALSVRLDRTHREMV
jgi:MFS family permease